MVGIVLAGDQPPSKMRLNLIGICIYWGGNFRYRSIRTRGENEKKRKDE
jgi:hypothetical protein